MSFVITCRWSKRILHIYTAVVESIFTLLMYLKSPCGENQVFNVYVYVVFLICFETNHVQLRAIPANRGILEAKYRLDFKFKSRSAVLLTKPKEINACFQELYKYLFTSKCNAPDSDITDFLDTIDIPKLSEAAREELDKRFPLDEILKAIKSF